MMCSIGQNVYWLRALGQATPSKNKNIIEINAGKSMARTETIYTFLVNFFLIRFSLLLSQNDRDFLSIFFFVISVMNENRGYMFSIARFEIC